MGDNFRENIVLTLSYSMLWYPPYFSTEVKFGVLTATNK